VTEEQLGAAAVVTLDYLEMYFQGQYAGNADTAFSKLNGTVTDFQLDAPPDIAFDLELLFNETSSFVPSKQEIDILMGLAFDVQFVQPLKNALRQLPESNPFSGTQSVVYTVRADNATDRNKASSSIDYTKIGFKTDGTENTNRKRYEDTPYKVTPFAVTFNISAQYTVGPSDQDVTEVIQSTLAYLDKHLRSTFDTVRPDAYRYIVGTGAESKTQDWRVGFLIGLEIQDESFPLSQVNLDMVVESAFLPPFLPSYLEVLKELPAQNPFSTTESVSFQAIPDLDDASRTSSRMDARSKMAIAGVTLAVFCCVLIAILLLLIEARRRRNCAKDGRPCSEKNPLIEIISAEDEPSARYAYPTVILEEKMLEKQRNVVDLTTENKDRISEFDMEKAFFRAETSVDPLALWSCGHASIPNSARRDAPGRRAG
jgi:hypothetical protein